jgi:hypothetical protein
VENPHRNGPHAVKLAEFTRLEERVAILERWTILLRNQEKSRRNRELMHEVETDD